ncbi:MAG: carbohydrate ABC transporter permease [Actinomycetota bacterium]
MATVTTPSTATESRPVRRPAGVRGRRGRGIWLHLALIAGLVLVAGPFVWMVLGSFKETAELRQIPPTWIPEHATLDNYRDLFDRLNFPRFFFNSALVAISVTVGNLLFCSMLGYALAKLNFPGKRMLLPIVLGTMMIPAFVTFMPLFVLVANMGLVNTHAGLILPFLAQGLGVFLMRQFISTIPDDLLDAARVDGAGEYAVFFRVVLPLCGPALATLGILTFLTNWNSFLWPLVVSSTEDLYTLPVAIALFSIGQQESNLGLQLAGSFVVILPVVLLFFAMQRYVIQGIATSGIK